eukprot:gnl/MRDRNA2_/MRDRNA2_118032_c0_seq1.p1 gnl/MRDRNA2_/MRDRNA2_118032_c0~~gnl/MRDRNA2_/MRDRNA2_118032_c0_seq1.p1  ORF type:complete len:348 (-),score=48.10 gnl/MRDRNA2_/MRDRNA2_118032_c0_seq1:16-1059(-)
MEYADNGFVNNGEMDRLANGGYLYEHAAKSIAPEIFGHLDVKKALLLMLIGGETKKSRDGLRNRGDIHVLLVGDPSVAKSQLLKQICNLAPRSVYLTGQGSTSAGLTASVTRDRRGEVTLERGAIVSADRGICCIDDLDKMEPADLHEVMERQTISIAKAGIVTTLNARASICAAASLAYGRYNPYKSVADNLKLPESLLSRFDITFIIVDMFEEENDRALAEHILNVHFTATAGSKHERASKQSSCDFKPLSLPCLRQYIARARQFDPCIDDSLNKEIVATYVKMRAPQVGRKSHTTPRQLISMLRLSQAVARARLATKVEKCDFDEAVRLIRASTGSIEAFNKSP